MSNNTNTNVGNNNSVLGSWALSSAENDTSCNSAFGTNSLLKHTTGSFNTSIGAGAMTFNITGSRNVAVGSSALEQNAKSENNTAIGTQALFGQRDGSNNTAIGINAGLNDVSGSFNTYLGANTGTDLSSNRYTKSTAIGYGATISGNNQIVLGTAGETIYIPGYLSLSNPSNTNISTGGGGGGPSTSLNSVFSSNNTIVGSNQIFSQGTNNSTGLGYGASITSSNQIVLGTSGEFVCIPSNRGLSIGKTTAPDTGIALDISGSISVLGEYKSDISGNTKIGTGSLVSNQSGAYNIAVGPRTLYSNRSGFQNVAIGYNSLYSNEIGAGNVAIGLKSLTSNKGDLNVAIGKDSLILNTNGGHNVAIGSNSLRSNITGRANVAIGFEAGSNKDMSNNNTFVGANADISGNATNITNSTALGYNAKIDVSNQIVLGTSTEFVCIPSNIGLSIGKATAPINALDILGSISVTGDYKSDVSFNTKIGTHALTSSALTSSILTGSYNVAAGYQSLFTNETGSDNTAVGKTSLWRNTTGYSNTAVGNLSLWGNTTGAKNTAIGFEAGRTNDTSNNTFLGACTDILSNATNITNSTALGYNAKIDVSNQIVLGTSGEFVCIPSNRGLSIGKTTAPTSGIGLDVSGSFAINSGLMSYNKDLFNVSLFSNGFYDNVNYLGYNVNNGAANIAIGGLSLNSYNNGNNGLTSNIAIGGQSMMNTTYGIYNVSIGGQSMINNKTGICNTSVGTISMKNQIDGSYNTSIGQASMEFGIRNNYNTSIGCGSGAKDISGSYNTYLGAYTGTDTSLNIYNNSTAIGSGATIDASNKIVLGTSQEFVCIPSYNGLSIGKTTRPLCAGLDISGSLIVSDEYRSDVCGNTKIGTSSLYRPIHGINNVAVGFLSLNNNTNGDENVAVGVESLVLNSSGDGNVALGCKSLFTNKTSGNNVAIGYGAGSSKDMSGNNTFVGSNADISVGATDNIQNSTAIGSNAKIDASNQIVLGTSNERVDIPGKLFVKNIEITSSGGGGTSTGANSDASNNTLLGTNSGISDTSIVNSTAIGYNAKVDASNQIVLGTSGEFVCIPTSRGVSIGKTRPPDNGIGLDVSGSIIVSGNITTGKNTKIGLDSGNNCSLGVNIKYVGSGYDSNYNPPSNSNHPPFNNDYLCEINGNNLVIKNLSVDARIIWSLLLTSTKPLPYSKSTPGAGFQNKLIGDINSTSSNINVIYTLKHTGIDVANRIEFLSDDNLCLYIIIVGSPDNILNSLSTLTINFNNSIDNINVYMFASRAKVSTSDSYFNTLKLNYTSTDNLKIFDQNQSNTQRETPQLVWSYNIIGSNNNTFVGSKSDFLSNIQINNSTSLGYNAKINVSNQIVLGTSGEFVCIPSNRGLSIGKITAPASGIGLDVSGSIFVTGDYKSDVKFNTKIGTDAMNKQQTGYRNTAVGHNSLSTNEITSANTAIGSDSLCSNVGECNTAVGFRSLAGNKVSSNNTAIGFQSGGSFEYMGYGAHNVEMQQYTDVDTSGNNTFLGANTYIFNTTRTNIKNSTAIGYGANIDVSNQIVLGTTGEFVCIPSNRGLSVGKNSKPTSMLDVSGSSIVSGDLTIRGTYYGDSSSNIKIGGVTSKTAGEVFTNTPFTTSPTTNIKLTISGGSIYIQNLSGSVVNHGGYVLESTTGFNRYVYTPESITTVFNKIGEPAKSIYSDLNVFNSTSPPISTGLTLDNLFYSYVINGGLIQQFSSSPTYLNPIGPIGSTLYKDISGQQIITLYLRISSSTGPTDNIDFAGYILQKVASITIEIPLPPPQNSTYLGANITYSSFVNTSTSTAIGYGANINVSNQIVLGTSGEFVCIPSTKGLSIGKTTAPATGYVLDVVGSIKTTGSVNASGTNLTSDYRIKDNVKNLDEQDTISKLRPVKYFNKQTNKNDFGLIAHELQSEYPDLVFGEKDGQEMQSVNYIGLISVIIKEVQELKRITSEQAKEIAELKSNQPLESTFEKS